MGAAMRKRGRAPARPWTRKTWELRQRLEQAIEDAIAALDAFDGDADLEDTHDREVCCEDEGVVFDDELSLGWLNPDPWLHNSDRTRWEGSNMLDAD